MGYNSSCVGNIIEMLARGVFAIVLLNDVSQILPQLTLVPWQRNLRHNWL